MGMEVIGRLHVIGETQQKSERFTKREFVLEIAENPKYPQTVQFQLTGDRVNQLDGMNVGDQVRVEFSLRGREWRSPSGEVKYFNSLDVWRVEPARAGNRARRDSNGRGGYAGMDPRDAPPPREFEPRPSDLGSRTDDDIPF